MRIVFVHPNYHSGGAEIAGNWPPAWVAYLAGALKAKGFDDIHFIDAMTHHMGPDDLRQRLADLAPDIIGTTAITPAIYEAEAVLKLAAEVAPHAASLQEQITPLLRLIQQQQELQQAPAEAGMQSEVTNNNGTPAEGSHDDHVQGVSRPLDR